MLNVFMGFLDISPSSILLMWCFIPQLLQKSQSLQAGCKRVAKGLHAYSVKKADNDGGYYKGQGSGMSTRQGKPPPCLNRPPARRVP